MQIDHKRRKKNMNDDDIFDEFNKGLKIRFNLFDDLFDSNFDEDNEDLRQRVKKDKNSKSKSYSISYKYSTGMKEPEIKVQGDVDEKTLHHFLQNIEHQFEFPKMNNKSVRLLNPHKGDSKENSMSEDLEKDAQIPFSDVIENKHELIVTLEMPGISADQIKAEYTKSGISVYGENGTKKYHKFIGLSFNPKKSPLISTNNGIITLKIEK